MKKHEEKIFICTATRLQKEHNESCEIPSQYSILFRNKTLVSHFY